MAIATLSPDDDLFRRLAAIIRVQANDGKEVTLETRLDEVDLDSIDLLCMIFGIQEELGVVITDSELGSAETVSDLYGYVRERTS